MFAVAFISPSMFNLDPAAFLWLASFWCVGDLKEWSSLDWSLIRSDYISSLFDKGFTHSPLQLVRSFPWHKWAFFFFFLAWGLVHDLKEIIHWRKILPLTLQASCCEQIAIWKVFAMSHFKYLGPAAHLWGDNCITTIQSPPCPVKLDLPLTGSYTGISAMENRTQDYRWDLQYCFSPYSSVWNMAASGPAAQVHHSSRVKEVEQPISLASGWKCGLVLLVLLQVTC